MRHRLRVPSHDFLSGQSAEDRDLCKVTEEELLITSLLEPRYRSFRMRVTVPQQRQPYVGVKEIQRVHNFFVGEV